MAAIRERRLELGGFETRALEQPDAEGRPPLLLFHGFSDSADSWRPLMALLAREGRGAMALDLPGFGEADRLAREPPILPQLDRFALAAIEHVASATQTGSDPVDGFGTKPTQRGSDPVDGFGTKRVIVAGNSLGGCVALRAAQRQDAPLAAIAPIAPAGLDLARWIGIVEGAWAVQTVLRSPVPLPTIAVRELLGRAYRQLASAHPGEVDPVVVANFTRHVRSKRDAVRLLGTARRLRPEIADPFELGWIRCPVSVVWGEKDRMVSPDGAKRILAEIPHATLELIPDCGHCPQVECPEIVSRVLGKLTNDLASSASRSDAARTG